MKLVQGDAATSLMSQPEFLAAWELLVKACRCGTVFQHPAFVISWYKSYSRVVPVLVLEYADDGALTGLLPLGYKPDTSTIMQAGGPQAEYQGWLVSDDCPDTFLADAIKLLIEGGLLFESIKFKYIPVDYDVSTFLRQLDDDRIITVKHRRPLLAIDAAEIESSFRKKSNKSKFSRLRRKGDIEFSRITSKEEFVSVIDTIIDQYDFRQGAANGSLPFFSDPEKKGFHVDWFEHRPEDFHVTVMRVGGEVVSSLIGIVDKGRVSVAIISYSPLYAAHSPGKLHLMQLARLLLNDGFHYIDLTPGGDPWKERFADQHDEVFEIEIYNNSSLRNKVVGREKAISFIKGVLACVKIKPSRLKSLQNRLSALTFHKLVSWVRRLWPRELEMRIYRMELDSYQPGPLNSVIASNQYGDFVYFQQRESWQSKQKVLSAALSRLEQGEFCYTKVDNERLEHFGWLAHNNQSMKMSEVEQEYALPEGSAVLYDFYTDHGSRGKGLYQSSITQMLTDLKNSGAAKYAYISVLADNVPSRHVIEKLGFAYQASATSKAVFGRLIPKDISERPMESAHE